MTESPSSFSSWKRPKSQLSTLLLAAGMGTALVVLSLQSDPLSGMARRAMIWTPVIYGLFGAILYGIAGFFKVTWGWWITTIFSVFIVFSSLQYLLLS